MLSIHDDTVFTLYPPGRVREVSLDFNFSSTCGLTHFCSASILLCIESILSVTAVCDARLKSRALRSSLSAILSSYHDHQQGCSAPSTHPPKQDWKTDKNFMYTLTFSKFNWALFFVRHFSLCGKTEFHNKQLNGETRIRFISLFLSKQLTLTL